MPGVYILYQKIVLAIVPSLRHRHKPVVILNASKHVAQPQEKPAPQTSPSDPRRRIFTVHPENTHARPDLNQHKWVNSRLTIN